MNVIPQHKFYFNLKLISIHLQFPISASSRNGGFHHRPVHPALRDAAVEGDGRNPHPGGRPARRLVLGGSVPGVRGAWISHVQLKRVAAGGLLLSFRAGPRLRSQLDCVSHDNLDVLCFRRSCFHRLRSRPHQQTDPRRCCAALQNHRRNDRLALHGYSLTRFGTIPPNAG